MTTNKIDVDNLLRIGLLKTRMRAEGDVSYGWNKKSAGTKVVDGNGSEYWLRVQFRESNQPLDRLWNGELTANFQSVKKPRLIKHIDWASPTLTCRADIMEYVRDEVCSRTPEYRDTRLLSTTWFNNLTQSLERLKRVKTDRVCTRQDLINRRVKERFGDFIHTDVSNWVTVHGDLHWANLTRKECWIFDWESWGTGPLGLDPAFLYCFSLLNEPLANHIERIFREELQTRDGLISRMFACAELLRMIELYNDHPDLKHPLLLYAGALKFERLTRRLT